MTELYTPHGTVETDADVVLDSGCNALLVTVNGDVYVAEYRSSSLAYGPHWSLWLEWEPFWVAAKKRGIDQSTAYTQWTTRCAKYYTP